MLFPWAMQHSWLSRDLWTTHKWFITLNHCYNKYYWSFYKWCLHCSSFFIAGLLIFFICHAYLFKTPGYFYIQNIVLVQKPSNICISPCLPPFPIVFSAETTDPHKYEAIHHSIHSWQCCQSCLKTRPSLQAFHFQLLWVATDKDCHVGLSFFNNCTWLIYSIYLWSLSISRNQVQEPLPKKQAAKYPQ